MKIEKLNSGNFIVADERIGGYFFTKTKRRAEEGLLKRGYRKGASDGCWIMPGDIILDEDPRA